MCLSFDNGCPRSGRSEFLVFTELVAAVEEIAQRDIIAFVEIDYGVVFGPYGLVVALRGFVLKGFQALMHDRVLLSQKPVDLLVGLANPGLEVDGSHCCSPGSAEPSRESGKEHPDS